MYDIICIRVEHMFRNDIQLVTCAKWEGTHPALPEINGQNEKKDNADCLPDELTQEGL